MHAFLSMTRIFQRRADVNTPGVAEMTELLRDHIKHGSQCKGLIIFLDLRDSPITIMKLLHQRIPLCPYYIKLRNNSKLNPQNHPLTPAPKIRSSSAYNARSTKAPKQILPKLSTHSHPSALRLAQQPPHKSTGCESPSDGGPENRAILLASD